VVGDGGGRWWRGWRKVAGEGERRWRRTGFVGFGGGRG